MNNVLVHYGVKGMKWGVRRFQNKDGSLTEEGQKRLALRNRITNLRSSNDQVNQIVDTLSFREKQFLGAPTDKKYKWIYDDIGQTQHIAKRIIEKKGNTPVAMIEAWDSDYNKGALQIAIATRSGKEYRGKGYANKLTFDMKKWFDKYGSKHYSEIEWWAHRENKGSNALAKKHGFKFDRVGGDGEFNLYKYNKK